MESSVRDHLRALILRFGPSLSEDPSRCEAMLRDLCGQHKREITVLIRALKQRVATDRLATSAGLPALMVCGRLRQRLEDDEAWALALGVNDAPALTMVPAVGWTSASRSPPNPAPPWERLQPRRALARGPSVTGHRAHASRQDPPPPGPSCSGMTDNPPRPGAALGPHRGPERQAP